MTGEVANKYPFWEPEMRGRIHEVYARVRENDPIHRAIGPVSGNPFWFITRYDDCVTALKHPDIGKNVRKRLPKEEVERYYGPEAGPDDLFAAINAHMLNMDPPAHTRQRSLIHKAFTPRMVENLRPRIEQIADKLLDAMADSDELDLKEHFALPLPIIVIAEMLGVPAADQDKFHEWSENVLFVADESRSIPAIMDFLQYMEALIQERRDNPRDDVISALVQAEEDGDKLSHIELLSMIFLLIIAGHETTVNLIGNGTLSLMQHPDEMAKLVAGIDDDDLLRSAIEEMLRFNGPVETTTHRMTFADVDFGHTVIPRGEVVLVTLLAANRDPAIFPDPDRFDIERQPNKHIAFGNGIHYCVGAPLARLEGQIAFRAMLKRFPKMTLNTDFDDLVWSSNLLLRGMKSLPVRLQP